MHQVIFRVPIVELPIYGFGLMLFAAFLGCTYLASWRAKIDGVAPEHVQNLALWIFLPGLVGARITYMIQAGQPITEFFEIWKGGLVFYGSLFGGFLGYLAGYFLIVRKYGLSAWKIADIIAPSVALGLCLGRVGCLLNGCCYGNVACMDCPAVHFPLSAPARYALVEEGWQTAAGFSLKDQSTPPIITGVEPGSPAERAGLQPGDVIVGLNEQSVSGNGDVWRIMVRDWPRGEKDLQLSIARAGVPEKIDLPSFRPATLGLHPTQTYESISTFLILLVLLAYFPFRRRDGEVIVLFLVCYSVHRFLNEVLRNDTNPVAFGLTLSQNGSVLLLAVSLVLIAYLGFKPVQYRPGVS